MSVARVLVSRCSLVAAALGALLAVAPDARPQLAQSPNAKLLDYGLNAAGGGAASRRAFDWTAFGALSSNILSSANAKAGIGASHCDDSTPVNNEPLVFGVVPPFGPKSGGTSVLVSGFNFNKFGVGPTVTMTVGGNAASAVDVVSNTVLTAQTPAGTGVNGGAGPQPVVVTSSLGSITHPEPWLNTPAITSSPVALVGAPMVLRNYGAPGNAFVTFLSDASTALNTQFGTFLIGGGTLLQIFTNVPYPGPAGVSSFKLKVPNMAVLHGLTIRFQSLSVLQLSPLQAVLTNASTTSLP